jgi:t-SNARE complex subunit (syntaxin)
MTVTANKGQKLMNRNDFMNNLISHAPKNITENEMDVLEQFTFKLYDETDLNKIESLKKQLDAWAEKYADLKIKSDANQWAHDNMQSQLSSANKKLATNKENDKIAEYHRQWEKEEKLESKN